MPGTGQPTLVLKNLQGILRLAHKNDCQVFLTLNIIVVESEIPDLIRLLNKLVNTSIDGIIIQDLGLFYILSKYFKSLKIHASTQLTTHNEGQLKFLSKLNAIRVNLSRELNIHEIKELTVFGHNNNVETEVFVHGSYCISFSGACYMSSVQSGNSGNRGRCSQPCRDRYKTTKAGKNYPLNLKDNSAFFDLKELADAGVDSLKIEGRIKEFEYVYTVVDTWRKQLNLFYHQNQLNTDNSQLYKVFNRDFSNSFLQGDIDKDMFIDDPMTYSTKYLSEINSYNSEADLEKDKQKLFEEKLATRSKIKNEIDQLNIGKIPLSIKVSGEAGTPLELTIKTPERSFVVKSNINLASVGVEALNRKMLLKRLKAVDDTDYIFENLDLNNLKSNVYLPFKELTSVKKKLLFILNDSTKKIEPVKVPTLNKSTLKTVKPILSVLISSVKDIHLCKENLTKIYFQLPNSFKNELNHFIDLFTKNEQLIPWFPSVLIGDDFTAALEFLERVKPRMIVSNNTGVAYAAWEKGIPWIAGPYLNIVNSYSLLTLKENFNCSGAFISNEISKQQIQRIKKPDNFELYFSIYHPIVLMTSRQCLFHQVTGCEKNKIENTCIQKCDKSSSITNLKNESFIIEKSKGNFHRVYSNMNYLNTDIIKDIQDVFSSFLIDLSDIKTKTEIKLNKPDVLECFENLLNGIPGSEKELKQVIFPTTCSQYKKGI